MKGPEAGDAVLDKVEAAIRRFRMFSQSDTVGVAVSGGRDSVCLLDVLLALAPKWQLRLIVLHVNHRFRTESDAEEEFVRRLAAQCKLECLVHRPELQSGNLEEVAREARLAFFESAPCDRVATAHTRSDQAETVLFRLLRGSGTTGLTGIRPVRGRIVRPMIDVSREEVDAWTADHVLAYCDDHSNTDPRFARNRIRHQLLPQLKQEWNPRLEEILANLASIAGLENDFFESRLPELELEPDGSVVLRTDTLFEAHPAIARRLIRRAVVQVKGDLSRIDFSHIERILQLKPGHDRVIIPGVDVIRSLEWIRVARENLGSTDPRNWSMPITFPMDVDIPGAQHISIGLHRLACRYNEVVAQLGAVALDKPLVLRNWRPGDRISREGVEISLKQLFQDARIPLWERRNWPVVECRGESEGTILWSGEFGAASYQEGGPYIKITRHGRGYRPILNQNSEIVRLKN